MRKRGLVLMVMLGVVLLVTSITEAFQNEPEGFRGLKWGDPPTEDMSYVDTVNVIIRRYRKVIEKLSEGNANLEFVQYNFYGEPEKLFIVYIVFYEEDNFNHLKKFCTDRFGEPTPTRIDRLRWEGKKAAIELDYYPKDKGGELTLSSRIGVTEATRLWQHLGKPKGISKEEQRKAAEVERLKRLEEQNKPPYYNEPDGFRGLKWGDPPGEDMVFFDIDKNNPDLVWYQRKYDKLRIGTVKLVLIYYLFYRNRLMKVQIEPVSAEGGYNSLWEIVEREFGPGEPYVEWRGRSCRWTGDITEIILEEQQLGHLSRGILRFTSTKIYNQFKEDKRRKEEEEKRKEEKLKAAAEGLADF